MRTRDDGSIAVPTHAFTPEYLELLSHRDEPVTAAEADASGPWHLEPLESPPDTWAVLREGESLAQRSTPRAVLKKKDAARLLAAVLPGTGRRPRYRLGKEPDAQGFYPLLDDGEVAGVVQYFDETLLAALNVADALVSIPRDLAWLLDASGGLALDHAGKIAFERAAEGCAHPGLKPGAKNGCPFRTERRGRSDLENLRPIGTAIHSPGFQPGVGRPRGSFWMPQIGSAAPQKGASPP